MFVPVSDTERSVEWYGDLFGTSAEETAHEGTIYHVEMDGETNLVLDANRPVENSSQPHCFFRTDDIEASREFLATLDVPVVIGPENVGSVTFLTVEDPDGNRLMVCREN